MEWYISRLCEGDLEKIRWVKKNSSYREIARHWAIRKHDDSIYVEPRKNLKKGGR